MRRAVRELSVVTHRPTGTRTVTGVTVSVGVAARPGPVADVAALLWAADAALYAAERDGGDGTRSG